MLHRNSALLPLLWFIIKKPQLQRYTVAAEEAEAIGYKMFVPIIFAASSHNKDD